MPEAWDKSREKAQDLRLEQWGTLEEVKAMAMPVRQVSIRMAAMDYRSGQCGLEDLKKEAAGQLTTGGDALTCPAWQSLSVLPHLYPISWKIAAMSSHFIQIYIYDIF